MLSDYAPLSCTGRDIVNQSFTLLIGFLVFHNCNKIFRKMACLVLLFYFPDAVSYSRRSLFFLFQLQLVSSFLLFGIIFYSCFLFSLIALSSQISLFSFSPFSSSPNFSSVDHLNNSAMPTDQWHGKIYLIISGYWEDDNLHHQFVWLCTEHS